MYREEIKELQRRDPEFGIIYIAQMPGVANSPGRVQAKPEWCDVSTWPSIARGWGCWVDLKVYMGISYQVGDDPWRQKLRLVFSLQLRKRPIQQLHSAKSSEHFDFDKTYA